MLDRVYHVANPALWASAAVIIAVGLMVTRGAAAARGGRGVLARFDGADTGLRRAMIALGVAYFLVYAYLSVQRYDKLLCGTWDLGIFASLFANALHGRFFVDWRGPFDHFQPTGAIYLALYALWHDVRFLLVLQSAAAAAAAWPLYLVAKRQAAGPQLPRLSRLRIYSFPSSVMACSTTSTS